MKIKDLTYEAAKDLCLYRMSEFGQALCDNCPLHTKEEWCYKNYLKGIRLDKFCPEDIKKSMQKLGDNEINFEIKSHSDDKPKKCKDCTNYHTFDCPNSEYCYALDSKPFFEPKRIFLLPYVGKKIKIYFKKEKGAVFCDKTTGILRYCVHPNHTAVGECYYLEQNGELKGINIYFIDKVKVLNKRWKPDEE